jgi:hypothetical protein
MMRDDSRMRTTLDLDEDVLQAAKELAVARRSTTGKVVSDLVRTALAPARQGPMRNGVPLFPGRWGQQPLTMALVNRLRDE